jgi:hypothetical protein
VCIPVEVRSAGFNQKLIFRCSMPHKLAEATYPGTIDEKLSSEVVPILHDGWKSGAVWFWHCITSVNAAWSLVEDHIGPRFVPISTDTERIFSQYWCQGSSQVAGRKVAEREEYAKQLRVLFDEKAGFSTEEETHG